jgi:dTDP-3-amino-3,4,6-trideoxy-alpha-D-glucose transaminase
MSAVPFLDLSAAQTELAEGLEQAYARVARSGRWILGEELASFERSWADACDAADAVGVASGMDALTLALRALGIGPGDEVVVPAQTFVATWLSVSAAGATPVGADVDAGTGNLDPAAAEAAIGRRTRAIVAVHLFGQPADMTALGAIAARHGLLLVEDAAQAHGARWDGASVGSIGHAAAFSFYPGKNLGALGDGGAVVTTDRTVGDAVRLLRNYGSPRKYVHEVAGVNSRLDELQAAFLSAKLPALERWNERRRSIAARYRDAFADLEHLRVADLRPEARPAWHLFAVRSPWRDLLAAHLAASGIETLVHYPTPPHRTAVYDDGACFPEAEAWAAEELSLPIGPHLADADVERVIEAVVSFRPHVGQGQVAAVGADLRGA